MATLTIPAPTLKYDPVETGLATLEKTVEVHCGAVTFPDGSSFTQTQQKTAGFFVYRKFATAIEVWNETAQQWQPDPGEAIAALKPKPFAFKSDQLEPWQSLFVPAGETAGEKIPLFQKASTGFLYFFRAAFVSNDKTGAIAGLSAPSPPVQFSGLLETIKAGIKINTEDIKDTTEIELFLRDEGRRIIGSVTISSGGGSAQVEIANKDASGTPRAVVQLLSSGDIVLRPIAGGRVRVDGLLETENILYLPSAPGSIGFKRFLT
jgi:hypothetical protein